MAIENLGNIVTVALVLLGLASIPFLSNSVTISAIDNYNEGLGPILGNNVSTSDAKYYPGKTVEKFGPQDFHYEASTAFGKLTIDIKNGEFLDVKQTLENNNVLFVEETTNNKTLRQHWLLQTSNFTLETEKYFSYVKETFSSPSGTCYKELNGGEISESCNGQVGRIESRWESAKKLMREYSEKMREVTSNLSLPNVQSSQWDY